MADVEISYNGDTIVSMSNSGTEYLDTKGKFMTDNITVDYVKPSVPTPTLQSKTVSPSTVVQTVSPDTGYDALSLVTVNAMPSGTAGTPTATKGSVSNHSISVTPSVTNIAGYITGGTVTGTAVTVSASELVSGTLSITSNATGIDVTNYASVDVDVSGGGGDDEFVNFITNHGTITSVNNSEITRVDSYAFYNCSSLQTVILPNCSEVYTSAFAYCYKLATVSLPELNYLSATAFCYCTSLTEINLPKCTRTNTSAFYYCTNLRTVTMSNCTSIGGDTFKNCYSLATISFPKVSIISANAFMSCRALSVASFPMCSRINGSAFRSCVNLISLYLGSSSVVYLEYSNAFYSTPIAGYTTSTGGVYGSIFVPSSLYDSYISATNWKYFSSRFVSV